MMACGSRHGNAEVVDEFEKLVIRMNPPRFLFHLSFFLSNPNPMSVPLFELGTELVAG